METGVNVTKAIAYVGLYPPTGVLVEKAVAYAVLGGMPNLTEGVHLIITETGGDVDRTNYLHSDSRANFDLTRGHRGTANLPLYIAADDDYTVETGWPVAIWEVSASLNPTRVWVGVIGPIKREWIGNAGDHIEHCSCTTLETRYDSIYVTPRAYFNRTPEYIVQDLLDTLDGTILIGRIQSGLTEGSPATSAILPSMIYGGTERLSDALAELASRANCVQYINPTDCKYYFEPAGYTVAPFTVQSDDLLFESGSYERRTQDYRNRELIQIAWEAFTPSASVFTGDDDTTTFDVPWLIDHVVEAYLTDATQASATGSFTGQPTAGDTITVEGYTYTLVAALDNRQWGEVLIGASKEDTCRNLADAINAEPDYAGIRFSLPTWENATCNATASGANITITAKIPGTASNGLALYESASNFAFAGGGGAGDAVAIGYDNALYPIQDGDTITINGRTYTFKTTLNDAVADQIKIWSDPYAVWDQQGQYVCDAINANPASAGVAYSAATTANTDFRATLYIRWVPPMPLAPGASGNAATGITLISISGAPPTLSKSRPESGWWIWQLITPSTGGADATKTPLTVGLTGSKADVTYTPGTKTLLCAVAPPSGKLLVIVYYRLGGNVIAVEDTDAVTARAAIEHGTGKYQHCITDTSCTNANDALFRIQQLLAHYGTILDVFTFESDSFGLLPGQLATLSIVYPTGASVDLDGTWLIEEVSATLPPRFRHFRYTIRASSNPVVSYVQIWEQLVSGAKGGGATWSSGTSSGGGTSTTPGGAPPTADAFGITIDGGGSAITTGSKGFLQMRYAGSITGWTILADQAGRIEFDLKKCAYSGFPTDSSVVASAPPELGSDTSPVSTAQKATSTTLTGWTTAFSNGDVFEFIVNSVATVQRVHLMFSTTRS